MTPGTGYSFFGVAETARPIATRNGTHRPVPSPLLTRMRIPLSLVPLALAATLSGQGLPLLTFMDKQPLTWPASVTRNGAFGRCVPARLTGHAAPDIVLLDGTQPRLLAAPGIHRHVGSLPMGGATTTTYDVAPLIGAGGHAGADGLVMVGPPGLRLWRPNDADQSPDVLDGTTWVNACRVSTHPLDGSRIWGVDAAKRRVLQMTESSGVWSAAAAIPASGITTSTILDIAAVDWNNQGALEVAVLTQNGLTVYDHQGYALTVEVPFPALSGSITRVAADNHAGEWIAWVAPKPPSQTGSVLFVLDPVTLEVVDLGTTQFISVSAGDCTIDGREDIVLSRNSTSEATILVNGYGATMPSPWTVFANQPGCGWRITIAGGSPAASAAPALLVDLDNDGDGDLFCPVEDATNGSVLTARSTLLVPAITSTFTVTSYDYGPNVAHSKLTFSLPSPTATHTQLVIWRRLPTGVMESYPYLSELIPVTTNQASFALELAIVDLGGEYEVMLRPVHVQNIGGVDTVILAEGAQLGTIYKLPLEGDSGTEVGGVTPQPTLPPPPPDPPPGTEVP